MREFLLKDRVQVSLALIIFLITWQVAAISIDNSIYLPTIPCVIKNLINIVQEESFIYNVGSSLFRSFMSFIIALLGGCILGLVSFLSTTFRNFFKPLNALSTSIPTMVLVVLALIWFDKDMAPFIVGTLIVFPILYEGILSSLLNINKDIIEMSMIYEVPGRYKFKNLYLPTMKLQILNFVVSTFSLGFKVVIAGEVHGQPTYGIGTVIQYEKINFNTEAIFAWIVILAIISFILGMVQKLIRKKIFKWKE